jgi:hypothetical protein
MFNGCYDVWAPPLPFADPKPCTPQCCNQQGQRRVKKNKTMLRVPANWSPSEESCQGVTQMHALWHLPGTVVPLPISVTISSWLVLATQTIEHHKSVKIKPSSISNHILGVKYFRKAIDNKPNEDKQANYSTQLCKSICIIWVSNHHFTQLWNETQYPSIHH